MILSYHPHYLLPKYNTVIYRWQTAHTKHVLKTNQHSNRIKIYKYKALTISMPIRKKTNPNLNELLKKMEGSDIGLWKAVAKNLKRPRRTSYEVNLFRLEKYADSKFTSVVPGAVLGTGELTKKLNVAAWKFSATAKEKIEKAGGKCLSLEELWETKKDGKGVQLLG